MNYDANTEAKSAADALMMDNVNKVMKQNPSTFHKAGLSSSRYASNFPNIVDKLEPLRTQDKVKSLVAGTEMGGGSKELSQGGVTETKASTTAENGKGKKSESKPVQHHLAELEPSKLIAAAMSSDNEGSSVKSALELLRENFVTTSQSSELNTQPDVQESSNRSQSVLQDDITPRPFPIRSISTDTFRGPSQRAQYMAKYTQEPSTSPLAQFNKEYERKEAHATNSPNAYERSDTKASAKIKLANAIASNPDLPKDILERVVTGTWYPISGPPFTYVGQKYDQNEGKGRITQRTRLRDASPTTKAKYAKLIEEGKWPGDEKPFYMPKSDSYSSLEVDDSEAESGGDNHGLAQMAMAKGGKTAMVNPEEIELEDTDNEAEEKQ